MVEKVERKGQLRAKRRAAGLCVECGAPSDGRYRCAACVIKRSNYNIKRRFAGLCVACGAPAYGYSYCEYHREKARQLCDKRKKSGRCPSCGRVIDKDVDNITCMVCKENSAFLKRIHSGGVYLKYK